ncbi:hypothetical protein [Dactylosporangium sp. NPDC049140]|uniref:hypothetical protein n=1 Tax=Dactylosporangium sp. NPDC049140 TaxID=3155647 RepID=UPI0033EC67BB
MRYLIQVNVAVREPAPSSRRDRYKAAASSLYTSGVRSGLYKRLADIVHEGVLAVGDEKSTAGARLADVRDFFLFIQDEMSVAVDRWEALLQERRKAQLGD